MDIVIDFDGTVVTHEYPKVGRDIGAQFVLKRLVEDGHNLILFTMRSDGREDGSNPLTDAVEWFKEHNIPLYGIQTNPTQKEWTDSPKAYGQIIIDDAALGCPLFYPPNERPFVNWEAVKEALIQSGVLKTS